MGNLLDDLGVTHYSEHGRAKQNSEQHIGNEQRLTREQRRCRNHGSTGEDHKKSKKNRILQHCELSLTPQFIPHFHTSA